MEKTYTVSVMNAEAFHTIFAGIGYSEMKKWLDANCIANEVSYGMSYRLKENELPSMGIPYSETGWKVVFGI